MITSLVDFSFIRSLVASRYSAYGPPPYDPASLFLLDLFSYFGGDKNMTDFLSILQDKDQGRAYRTYAGICMGNIPCEGTLSIFRCRIGETLYNEIFHVLVNIFHQLEMITFKVLSVDGTLYATWARYRGCCYFDRGCKFINVPQVIEKVRNRILYRLNNLAHDNFGSESRVYVECRSDRFPCHIKKPKVEVFAFRLAFCYGEPTKEQQNTAILIWC